MRPLSLGANLTRFSFKGELDTSLSDLASIHYSLLPRQLQLAYKVCNRYVCALCLFMYDVRVTTPIMTTPIMPL